MSTKLTNHQYQFLAVIFLIFIGISTRFIFIFSGESWLPNFTALGAIVLFSAAYLKGKNRIIIPFAALWISDMILNNVFYSKYFDSYQLFGDIWVYGAYACMILCAWFLMNRVSWSRVVGSSLLIGIVFYLISNFGVWLSASSPYPKSLVGLIECYAAALPFFRNTLLSNVFYSLLLFGAYEYGLTRIPILRPFRLINR